MPLKPSWLKFWKLSTCLRQNRPWGLTPPNNYVSFARTLAGRKVLTYGAAVTIARKLDAEISEGRKHTSAVIRIDGTYIGRFGLRRDTDASHNYIPKQIGITMKDALGLARCTLYKPDYEERLRNRRKLPPLLDH